ncbi:MAG: hypothetical protein KIS81_10650 [Maricaulaceae bacterium]|nr:hypothetical protein [Maricaulaceae bacterium]
MPEPFDVPERFTVSGALMRFFRLWLRRPGEAMRLMICDALAIILILGFGQAWMLISTGQDSAAETIVSLALVAAFFTWLWLSDAAWQKALTGQDVPRGVAYRVGRSERRFLGAYVMLFIGHGAGVLFAVPVFFVLGLLLIPTGVQDLLGHGFAPFLATVVSVAYAYGLGRFIAAGPSTLIQQRMPGFDLWRATRPFRFKLALACYPPLLLMWAAQFVAVTAELPAGPPPLWVSMAFTLAFVVLIFGMLRGIAAEAALAIHAAESEGADAEPVNPPSSASGRGPGHAPEPA